VCKSCDRGQRYCSKACSEIRRAQLKREANQRYAATWAGRYNNAKRQSDSRARQREKRRGGGIVTGQGSAPGAPQISSCAIDLIRSTATNQAVRLLEMARVRGYPGGSSHFRARVAQLRPRKLPEAYLCQARRSILMERAVQRVVLAMLLYLMTLGLHQPHQRDLPLDLLNHRLCHSRHAPFPTETCQEVFYIINCVAERLQPHLPRATTERTEFPLGELAMSVRSEHAESTDTTSKTENADQCEID